MNNLDQKDLETAYRRYYPIIRAKCARMLKDHEEAEDVAQETFIRLWRRRKTIEDPRAISAWIYRTSTNLAIDRLRRSRRTGTPSAEAFPESVSKEDLETSVHFQQALENLVCRTPASEMRLAVLCRIDGLSQEEAGEVTGMSGRSVRRLLAKFDRRVAKWRQMETNPLR